MGYCQLMLTWGVNFPSFTLAAMFLFRVINTILTKAHKTYCKIKSWIDNGLFVFLTGVINEIISFTTLRRTARLAHLFCCTPITFVFLVYRCMIKLCPVSFDVVSHVFCCYPVSRLLYWPSPFLFSNLKGLTCTANTNKMALLLQYVWSGLYMHFVWIKVLYILSNDRVMGIV